MGFDLAQASDEFLWFFSWGTAPRLSVVPTGVSAPATANTAITSAAGVFRVEMNTFNPLSKWITFKAEGQFRKLPRNQRS